MSEVMPDRADTIAALFGETEGRWDEGMEDEEGDALLRALTDEAEAGEEQPTQSPDTPEGTPHSEGGGQQTAVPSALPEGYQEILEYVRAKRAEESAAGQTQTQAPAIPQVEVGELALEDGEIEEAFTDPEKFRAVLKKATEFGAKAALAALQSQLPETVRSVTSKDAELASSIYKTSSEWRAANADFVQPKDELGKLAFKEFESLTMTAQKNGQLALDKPEQLRKQLDSIKTFVSQRYELIRGALNQGNGGGTGGNRVVMPSPTSGGGTRRTVTQTQTNKNSLLDSLGDRLVGFSQ